MENKRNRKSLRELIERTLEKAEAEGVRFMTFNVATEDKTKTAGRIVVAYHFDANEVGEDFEELTMQFAFCSPRDTFDRKYGEFIAARRLYAPGNHITARSTHQLIRTVLAVSLITEALRRDVPWMRKVFVKDLR